MGRHGLEKLVKKFSSGCAHPLPEELNAPTGNAVRSTWPVNRTAQLASGPLPRASAGKLDRQMRPATALLHGIAVKNSVL
jgi:hypothetical protein